MVNSKSSHLRLLLRLWWQQQRRTFSWRTLFMEAYFGLLYVLMVVLVWMGLHQDLDMSQLPFVLLTIVPLLAVSIVPGDLMLKLIWRRSPVEMDDALRSRPVDSGAWGAFIFIDTASSIAQWMLPLAIALPVSLFMSPLFGLLALVLGFSSTLVNALFQNCWRRAPGNAQTLPLFFGYIAWLFVAYIIAIAAILVFGLIVQDATPWNPDEVEWGTMGISAILLCLNAFVSWLLHRYFCRMKNYNENESHATTVHQTGDVSLRRMEWTAIWRSKRLRKSLLIVAPIFLVNTYIQQMQDVFKDFGLNTMLLFGVGFPAVLVAQYGLGIEANFFHGVWSKPWSVADILLNKFNCYCAICGVMAVCCLPAVIFMGMSLWTLLAVTLFSMGVFVLSMMPMCLFCSRLDLFTSAFFNYQGANKLMNVYSFIMFVPMLIYYLSAFFMPAWASNTLMAALGLVGLALHRVFIRWLAGRWKSRRYSLMEKWNNE